MPYVNPQILIAGAGPTGLTLANLLAKTGIPFLLIDKNAHPSRDSKAFGIHARTMEVFSQFDMAGKAIAEGNIDNTVHILVKSKEAVKFRLKEMLPGETRYPYFLILQQDKTEKLMIEALKRQSHTVHWKHELTHMEVTDTGVSATIKGLDGVEKQAEFQYLIGCDGAGSTVRKQGGFSYTGKTFSSSYYLADCEIDWEFTHGDIYFIFAPQYITGLFSFREQNRYRVFNFMNDAVHKEPDDELTQKDVQHILDANPYLNMQAKNMDWSSVFKIHMRYTDTFGKGRVMLAGDAAHAHTPAGGQGMNTGIQDAYNLAWKLSLVLKGKAAPQLLQSYSEERQPIAKNLHNTTDQAFSLITHQNIFANFFRMHITPKVFRLILGIPWLRKPNLMRFSQLAIKYRYSALSKNGATKGFYRNAPQAGDRAPYCQLIINGKDADSYQLFEYTHFTIFIAVAEPDDERAYEINKRIEANSRLPVSVYRITRGGDRGSFFTAYGIKKDAVFIVRPDNHIGFRSSRLDYQEIEDYFTSLLMLS
jgi:2-polyprenyl-6-methoxyphenol hydroxylase-like FAD-dependent oxidoreductase